MHYLLKHIIEMVQLLGQTDFNIMGESNRYSESHDLYHKPVDIAPSLDPTEIEIDEFERAIEYLEFLESLFQADAQIILETLDFDGDGGPCYNAYIINPLYRKHYQDYWDTNYERNGAMLWQAATMEYILKYPNNVLTVWSGPY